METDKAFTAEIPRNAIAYDTGRHAAEAVYEVLIEQNPIRSNHDLVKCAAGFSVGLMVRMGRDYAAMVPNGNRTAFQADALRTLAGSLMAVAAGFEKFGPTGEVKEARTH